MIITCKSCDCLLCVYAPQMDVKDLLGLPFHVFEETLMQSKGWSRLVPNIAHKNYFVQAH